MVELRMVILIIKLIIMELIVLVLEDILLVELCVLLLLEVLRIRVSHSLDLLDELGDLRHRDQLLIEDVRMLCVELLGGVHGVGVEHQLLQENCVDALLGVGLLLLVDDADHWGFVSDAQLCGYGNIYGWV